MATPTKIPGTQEPTEIDAPSRAPSGPPVVIPDSAVVRPIPPVRPLERSRELWMRRFWVAIAALTAALLVAVVMIVWQRGRVDDATSELSATQSELTVALDDVVALQADVDRLEARLAQAETRTQGLEREVERLTALLNGSESAGQQTEAQLEQTQAELTETQAELATAQSDEVAAQAAAQQAEEELLAITGPRLADGAWFGRLYMVGGTQIPPMLAFDAMQLYRGQAAIDAMIADGVPPAQAASCGNDCVYWRNPSTEWRVLRIAGDAAVTLRAYPTAGSGPTGVDLERFTRIFNSTDPAKARIGSRPYRLTMSGGEVTAIEERHLPW